MNFVKSSVIHNSYESVKYDDQTSGLLNQKGKAGIGYSRPENSKLIWLNNILEKDKAKDGSKSSVPNQSRRGSKKVKSVFLKVQPERYLNGQNTKPKLNRSHNISTHTIMDSHTGKNVKGKFFGVSEDLFAGVFELPTTGLTDVDDVPKNLVYDTRSIFSKSGEPVQISCKMRKMKNGFRLLNDILAKSVTVKAGSFDSVTHERFILMTAIHFGLQINWSKILFDILKGMVTKTSNEAKGFSAHICALQKSAPNLTMGEAKTFPPLKILTAKTVGMYISKQKGIDDSHEEDEPVVKKTPVKKVVS
ncbi:hypothetical protein F511_34975 [Dorcoceras hygrometricum]|uniref:Uncharacterized protein n=1 Tax=Dorcoceras hygrometricum TaxID=472368 RepID=A0A2Z7B5M2_9LAMI|nr:hypothetical protein F511_34975 [Dorcoceras hygrometricum]